MVLFKRAVDEFAFCARALQNLPTSYVWHDNEFLCINCKTDNHNANIQFWNASCQAVGVVNNRNGIVVWSVADESAFVRIDTDCNGRLAWWSTDK
jgi:hypothetical protein